MIIVITIASLDFLVPSWEAMWEKRWAQLPAHEKLTSEPGVYTSDQGKATPSYSIQNPLNCLAIKGEQFFSFPK